MNEPQIVNSASLVFYDRHFGTPFATILTNLVFDQGSAAVSVDSQIGVLSAYLRYTTRNVPVICLQ